MTDPRDGTMQSVNGPLPPEQARIVALAPVKWASIPHVSFEVSELVLRALKERGLIETRWHNATVRQWRRTPVEATR